MPQIQLREKFRNTDWNFKIRSFCFILAVFVVSESKPAPKKQNAHSDSVRSLAVLDSDTFLSGGSDGRIWMWQRKGKAVENTFQFNGQPDRVRALIRENESVFWSGGDDRTLYKWQKRRTKALKQIRLPKLPYKRNSFKQPILKLLPAPRINRCKSISMWVMTHSRIYYYCGSGTKPRKTIRLPKGYAYRSSSPDKDGSVWLSLWQMESGDFKNGRVAKLNTNGTVKLWPKLGPMRRGFVQKLTGNRLAYIEADGMLDVHIHIFDAKTAKPLHAKYVVPSTTTGTVFGTVAHDNSLVLALGWPPMAVGYNYETFRLKFQTDMFNKALCIKPWGDNYILGIKGGRVAVVNKSGKETLLLK